MGLIGQISIARAQTALELRFQVEELKEVVEKESEPGDHITLHPGDFTNISERIEVPESVTITILPGAKVEYAPGFRLEDFRHDGDTTDSTDGSGARNHPLSVSGGAERYAAPNFDGFVENINDLNFASEWAFELDLEQLRDNFLDFKNNVERNWILENTDTGQSVEVATDGPDSIRKVTFSTVGELDIDFDTAPASPPAAADIQIIENVDIGVSAINPGRLLTASASTGNVDLKHEEIFTDLPTTGQGTQAGRPRLIEEVIIHESPDTSGNNTRDGHVEELLVADLVAGTDLSISVNEVDPGVDEITFNHDSGGTSFGPIPSNEIVTGLETDGQGHVQGAQSQTAASALNLIEGTDIRVDGGNEINHANTGGASNDTNTSNFINSITFDGRGHVESIGTSEVVESLSAGTDISLVNSTGDVTVNHSDTGADDFSGSGGTVVNNVQTDGRGHLETISGTDLDNRYYQQSEVDNNFVDENGDSMTGTLTIKGSNSLDLEGDTAVNDITTSLGNPGNNDTLVTEAAIRTAVNNASGSITSVSGGTDINVSSTTGAVIVNHANTGGAQSTGNTGGTVVQNLNTNGRGHVNGVGTTNLDNRYYTQGTADGNFVDESGDTMSGSLTINGTIQLNNGTSVNGIDTSVGDPGSDNRLVTEEGIREALGNVGGDVTSVSGGTDINVPNTTGNVTVNHANTGGAQNTGNSGGTVIQSINTDGNGHVNGVSATNLDGRFVNESGDTMTGSLTVQSTITATNDIRSQQDVIAQFTSDERFKDEMEAVDLSLDRTRQLAGYKFRWNEKIGDSRAGDSAYGVSAQEVQKVFPHAVTERDDGTLAVDYKQLHALHIQNANKLRDRIARLERKVENLK